MLLICDVDEVLAAVLPKEVEFSSGFETAGHLAHLNLVDELLPFQYLIGQVILEKNSGIKTVVTKTKIIDSVFRTFPMRVLAGEENFEVEVV